MQRWRYHYAGLRIISDFPLPEWQISEGGAESDIPDVCIVLDDRLLEGFVPEISADRFSFRVEEIAVYSIEGGKSIRIAVHPNAGMREVRLFLLGSAWGALCYQRGLLALHASVVGVGRGAVAFCGASGAGKSSMAAWFLAQGYPLIADDLCLFDLSGNPPRVHPAAPRLKLWRDALSYFQWETDSLERDHFRMDKFHIPLTGAESGQPALWLKSPLPLRAVYLLAWGEAELVRLKGLIALQEFVKAATYRGELLAPMGQEAAHWNRCAAIARSVPIFRLVRPQDWSAVRETEQLLRASLQSLERKSEELLY